MNKQSTVFVSGATGRQGRAVVENLLKNKFNVIALTRDAKSDKAKYLQLAGAKLKEGNLDDMSSYESALDGVDAVFSVQTYEHGIERETKQGIMLADAAKKHKAGHFVYSSVIGCDMNSGIPHWENKKEVEDHIRSLGIPYTILRPSSFFENLLMSPVRPGILKGKLTTPTSQTTRQHMISVQDIGRVAAKVFKEPQTYNNQVLTLATECMDANDISKVLSGVVGKEVKHQKLPWLIMRVFLGKKLTKMFNWVDENSERLRTHIDEHKFNINDPVSFEEWAKENFGQHRDRN